jgi:hypothetical protein
LTVAARAVASPVAAGARPDFEKKPELAGGLAGNIFSPPQTDLRRLFKAATTTPSPHHTTIKLSHILSPELHRAATINTAAALCPPPIRLLTPF